MLEGAAADAVPKPRSAVPAPPSMGCSSTPTWRSSSRTASSGANGLEVARVHDVSTAGVPLDEPLLEVGVGQADRELTGMLHGDLAPIDQLSRAAEIVRLHRRPDATLHPLNQLVPERWLRARCVSEPGRIGLVGLQPAEPAVPRSNPREQAAGLGRAPDGETVVAMFSVGIDLDLVPAAADTRLVVAPGARLLLVVLERDAHPITVALAARLVEPAEVIAMPGDWRR